MIALTVTISPVVTSVAVPSGMGDTNTAYPFVLSFDATLTVRGSTGLNSKFATYSRLSVMAVVVYIASVDTTTPPSVQFEN